MIYDGVDTIQLRVDEELKKRIKMKAVEDDITIQDEVEKAVESFLKFAEETSRITFIPTLKSRGVLTGYRLRKNLHDKLKAVSERHAVSIRVTLYTALVHYFEKEGTSHVP